MSDYYNVLKLSEGVYAINNSDLCPTYVIIGEQKAMIIDTGIKSDESLKSEVLKLINKPFILALTHGHFDHNGHIEEFDSFYMCKQDDECFENKELLKNRIDIVNEQEFDLGGIIIKALIVPSHTKGSVIFIDEKHHLLFTGDCFGSGCGVWMQMAESTSLSKYIQSTNCFLSYLKDNYDYNLSSWIYYGGHLGQEYTSRISNYNPLNYEMVLNIMSLCQQIVDNKIKMCPSTAIKYTDEDSLYASYKNAEIVTRKSLMK